MAIGCDWCSRISVVPVGCGWCPRVWLCQLDVFDAQLCGQGNWMSLVPTRLGGASLMWFVPAVVAVAVRMWFVILRSVWGM